MKVEIEIDVVVSALSSDDKLELLEELCRNMTTTEIIAAMRDGLTEGEIATIVEELGEDEE